MTPEELRARVAEVRFWHHQMNLGQGVVTPGRDAVTWKLQLTRLPADLTGKSVLDVGTWDGAVAFEAERRGARLVVATDTYAWQTPKYSGRAGFDLAHEALASKVQPVVCDPLKLDTLGQQFDLVLFFGVLYHMRHPLLSLEQVFAATAPDGVAIIETHVAKIPGLHPAARFYERDELDRNPTNWWGPNPACVAAMCRAVGFVRVAQVGVLRDRAAFHAFRGPV